MISHTARSLLRALAALVFTLGAGSALALSVGEIELHSRLGEALEATVPLGRLGALTQSDVQVARASDDVYRSYGIDLNGPSSALKFSLQVDRKGVASVRVSSDQPVSEPYLDFVLDVRWPAGRSVKRFTLLLDPPSR